MKRKESVVTKTLHMQLYQTIHVTIVICIKTYIK